MKCKHEFKPDFSDPVTGYIEDTYSGVMTYFYVCKSCYVRAVRRHDGTALGPFIPLVDRKP